MRLSQHISQRDSRLLTLCAMPNALCMFMCPALRPAIHVLVGAAYSTTALVPVRSAMVAWSPPLLARTHTPASHLAPYAHPRVDERQPRSGEVAPRLLVSSTAHPLNRSSGGAPHTRHTRFSRSLHLLTATPHKKEINCALARHFWFSRASSSPMEIAAWLVSSPVKLFCL
jgi:hypothetical protein